MQTVQTATDRPEKLVPIEGEHGIRARLGGRARQGIYDLFEAGKLVKVKVGKRTYATESSINALIRAGIEAGKAA
jgi:hypothetical protein